MTVYVVVEGAEPPLEVVDEEGYTIEDFLESVRDDELRPGTMVYVEPGAAGRSFGKNLQREVKQAWVAAGRIEAVLVTDDPVTRADESGRM